MNHGRSRRSAALLCKWLIAGYRDVFIKKNFFYILNPGHCSISAHGLRHALRQNFKKYKCLKSLKLQICKTTKMRKLQICKPKVENCKSANQKAENCKFANQQKNKTTNLQIRKVWNCKFASRKMSLQGLVADSRFHGFVAHDFDCQLQYRKQSE